MNFYPLFESSQINAVPGFLWWFGVKLNVKPFQHNIADILNGLTRIMSENWHYPRTHFFRSLSSMSSARFIFLSTCIYDPMLLLMKSPLFVHLVLPNPRMLMFNFFISCLKFSSYPHWYNSIPDYSSVCCEQSLDGQSGDTCLKGFSLPDKESVPINFSSFMPFSLIFVLRMIVSSPHYLLHVDFDTTSS